MSVIPSMQPTATVLVTFSESIERKKQAGAARAVQARTTGTLGADSAAEKQSDATMRYEAAVPTQFTRTAQSTTQPEDGRAASHSVKKVAFPRIAGWVDIEAKSSRLRLVSAAHKAHRMLPPVNCREWDWNTLESKRASMSSTRRMWLKLSRFQVHGFGCCSSHSSNAEGSGQSQYASAHARGGKVDCGGEERSRTLLLDSSSL